MVVSCDLRILAPLLRTMRPHVRRRLRGIFGRWKPRQLHRDGIDIVNYESWRISFQSSEQAARAAFEVVRRMRGEQEVLARLLGDALAVLRTIDPMDTAEMDLLEGLMERAQKACDSILTPNAPGEWLDATQLADSPAAKRRPRSGC